MSVLYTVQLGSNDPLKKGVARLEFKVVSPVLAKAVDYIFNRLNSGWDRVLVPNALNALKAKGVTNVRFPSGNFYVDKDGNMKPSSVITSATAKAKGYSYCPRKGYNTKTGVAWVYLVVS